VLNASLSWPCAELTPQLIERARGELLAEPAPVQVWLWRTDFEESRCAGLARVLSPAERAAAERFRFPRDRARALVSRAGLRLLLGGYLNLPAENVAFAAGGTGKPRLAGTGAVSFNLSHSGACAAAAVSRGRELGIDIEQIRPDAAWRDIAARFFSPEERAWLDSRVEPGAFFRLWTAKEAVLKAAGTGLAAPLHRICVRPGEDAPPWNLRELDLAAGYAGAVAFDGPPAILKVMTQFGYQ
jgi:4'-phosphopantetheinyl transferase